MSPDTSALRTAATAGLVAENAALVQLLGLCPLLAVTTSVVNGLALGIVTAAVLVVTSTLVSLLRGALVPWIRVPLFVSILAVLVTCVDLLASALLYELHETLALFIPLIVTNCALLAHAENVASRRPAPEAFLSAVSTGLGFAGVLVLLGALREVVGSGTLLANLALLTGGAESPGLTLPFEGMQVALLPPGAFFGMAALLALRNRLASRRAKAPTDVAPSPVPGAAR